jgi:hypothetical protein
VRWDRDVPLHHPARRALHKQRLRACSVTFTDIPYSDRWLPRRVGWGAAPAFAESCSSVFDAPCGTKPEAIYPMIEKLAPGPLLELFGTQVRPGWPVVGNHIATVPEGLATAAD